VRTPGDADSAALLALYLEELRAQRYSDSLQEQARRVLPRLFKHLKESGIQDVRAVQEEHLVSFALRLNDEAGRVGAPLARGSQVVYLSAVKRFFAFLDRRSLILVNPALALVLPRVERLPRGVLSIAQARCLMETPSPLTSIGKRDRALLETLYGTALRLSECARTDLADLDLGGQSLLVRNGKGRKDRIVPVTGRAIAALDVYLKDARPSFVHDPQEQALFLGARGQRLKRVTIYSIVRNCGRATGLKIAPHGLRHACATHLLKGGASVRHVQELLGHAHLDTTVIYTRVDRSDLRELIARSHPRYKLK
jgi:integrase/recombinase XerD